jgi:acetyltransferase
MVKPIIALKAGRTPAGREAVQSHLGTRPGVGAVFGAALARAGVLPVQSFEALLDCAEFLARGARARGWGLAIVTNAGGQGVMAVDALSDIGGRPAAFRAETISQLAQAVTISRPIANPVYLGAEAFPSDYQHAVGVCQAAPEVEGLLVVFVPRRPDDAVEVARAVAPLLQASRVPAFAAWIGGHEVAEGRAILTRAGIPNFGTVERAIQAYCHLNQYARHIELLQEVPRRLTRRPPQSQQAQDLVAAMLASQTAWLDPETIRILLGCYGIEGGGDVVVPDAEAAVRAGENLSWPVVLCRLDFDPEGRLVGYQPSGPLENASELRRVYAHLTTEADRAAPAAGRRLLTVAARSAREPDWTVEIRADRGFGPYLVVRTGACPAQHDPARAIALPPLNRALARQWLERAPGFQRWQATAWNRALLQPELEEALVALSQMAVDLAALEVLQAQLTAGPDTLRWSGVQIRVRPPVLTAPLHLAISPYPRWQEVRLTTSGGRRILVRPIRPEDAPLLENLFAVLSPQTIYRRFFNYIKSLSVQMLARFTQIDYDREVALIALDDDQGVERMLGVARVITLTRGGAEFAVLVGDPWQGQGIGAELLLRCLHLVKARGIETVVGTVLAENTQMLALGRKLGFDLRKDADSGEYVLRIDLTRLPEARLAETF